MLVLQIETKYLSQKNTWVDIHYQRTPSKTELFHTHLWEQTLQEHKTVGAGLGEK